VTADARVARVPNAPRVPSRAAEALLQHLDSKDKSAMVGAGVWVALQLLGSVLILSGDSKDGPPAAGAIVPFAFGLLGMVMLAASFSALRARRPTFVSGTPARGEISSSRQRAESTTLFWTFRDRAGVPFTGVLTTRKRSLLGEQQLAVGSDIVVLYEPANPKRNMIWLD